MEYTVQELMDMVNHFCEERNWGEYHNPKDLAIGISTEANELLDIFRFKSPEDMDELMKNEKSREHVGEELADVLFFLLRFAHMNDLDLKSILADKIVKNGRKYPVKE